VDWRIGGVCGGVGAVFALAGAKVSDVVDARWLMIITAGLLAWSGASAIRRSRRRGADPAGVVGTPAPGATSPGPGATAPRGSMAVLGGVGAASGFVAGLLGVGGGVVMMPVFTGLLRIPVKVAVASSLVAVAIFSVPALVAHAWLGHIDWPVALLLVVGTVPGAHVGSRLTIGQSDQRVELLLGSFFLALAVVFGGTELVAML
jgi:uncharacterized membrane protein YfcA